MIINRLSHDQIRTKAWVKLRKHYTQDDIALKLGVTRQSVQGWEDRGCKIPSARIIDIETHFGGFIKRHEMAPDLFEGYSPDIKQEDCIDGK